MYRSRVKAPARSPIGLLRRRLVVRSLDTLIATIEALAALPDSELAPLLAGVGTAPAPERDPIDLPVLTRSAFFTGKNTPEQAWLDVAMLRFAARVSDRFEAARALRRVTELRLVGGTNRASISLPLDALAPYTELRRLALSNMHPLGLGALAALTKLREVILDGCALISASELRACASIETLSLRRCGGEPLALGAWPTLRALEADYPPPRFERDALAGLTGLESLRIKGLTGTDFDTLGAPASLRSLALPNAHLPNGLRGIERCVALRALDLTAGWVPDLEPLRGHPSLTSLNVERHLHGYTASLSLAPLATIPTLRSLNLRAVTACDLDALRGLALESLDVAHSNVADLSALQGSVALRTLTLASDNRARSLDALSACTSLEALVVEPAPSLLHPPPQGSLVDLKDLRWASKLTRLQKLSLDAPSLQSLDGVEGLSELTELCVTRASGLVNLSPISKLTRLARVVLMQTRVSDVAPLASLPALTTLDLRGNGALVDATPLWGMASLRRVGLADTKVPRDAVPKECRHRVTWARDADMDRVVDETEPPKPRAVLGPRGQGAAVRKRFSAIRAQLNAKDFDQIEQGAELLAALDDPSLFDEMIAGAVWNEASGATRGASRNVGFTPPPALGATKRANAFQTAAILAVISRAPAQATAATALRDAVRTFSFSPTNSWATAGTLDLAPLAKLPNLTKVSIERPGDLRHGAALKGNATLESFELSGVHCDLALDLSNCANLRTLSLTDVSSLASLDLSGCTALRRLDMRLLGHTPTLAGARDLTSLRRVSLQGAYSVDVLTQLRGLERVEHLSLTHAELPQLDELISRCSELRSIEIRDRRAALDCEALAAASKLTKVTLVYCLGVTDLTPLKKLQSLEALKVSGCSVTVPDELRSVCR